MTTKDGYMTLVMNQYHNHNNQVSGVWSVTEEVAKRACDKLGVSYQDAVDYAADAILNDATDYAYDVLQQRKRVYSEDGVDFTLEEQTRLLERKEQEYINDHLDTDRPSYNAYFWWYVKSKI